MNWCSLRRVDDTLKQITFAIKEYLSRAPSAYPGIGENEFFCHDIPHFLESKIEILVSLLMGLKA
jgi:hypothetical protein